MRNQNGSTTIEMAMVMTILVLFGITIYTLISSGANTQARIQKEKDAQADARVALSYINVRLRQSDSAGKIGVERIDLTGEDALVIRERTMEYEYDTWIFSYGGKLLECLTDAGVHPTELDSFFIVDTERLETSIDEEEGTVTNTLSYYYGDSLESISSTIYMRSHQGD